MRKILGGTYLYACELGRGRFGRVLLARDEVSLRLVAIKRLSTEDSDAQRRIIAEIRAVAQLNHPNVVTFHHHFLESGRLHLVMESCRGGSLRHQLQQKTFTAADALNWIQTVAETMVQVHAAGLRHHDLKPENLLFGEHRAVKISDFGVGKVGGGTLAYQSPEAFTGESESPEDRRIDVYALGVTFLELLTGVNPFLDQTRERILALHQKCRFPVQHLPRWQRDLILKAIHRVPELRFQSMGELVQAIRDAQVPRVLSVDTIRAGDAAERAERLMSEKQWYGAASLLYFANGQYPNHANLKKAFGRYFLLRQRIEAAQDQYDAALKIDPRLDVRKELGWIQLEWQEFPTAISILNDHLHRHPSDLEAHNLLLQCFYGSGQYETASDLAQTLVRYDCHDPCFANNLYLARVMQAVTVGANPARIPRNASNDFLTYNHSVVAETTPTHNGLDRPTLKSKLLFMDYRFRHRIKSTLYFTRTEVGDEKQCRTQSPIVTFGRHGYDANQVQVPPGGAVCRRHCLIVNCRSEVWVFDLESAGTFLNNAPVKPKAPLGTAASIRIGRTEYRVLDRGQMRGSATS